MRYNFDWDPAKERRNIRKHKVAFRRVVIHTFEQVDEDLCEIRIISARKATSAEANQYREGNIL